MKKILLITFYLGTVITSIAQDKKSYMSVPDKSKKILLVDAACGECRLGLTGTTCDLAIRIKGKSYFVDGTDIDSHGDAHSKDGFCNSIRKAKVQGEIINDRFIATYFQLVPVPVKKNKLYKGVP